MCFYRWTQLVGSHEVLDILGMVGDAFLAQEAAAVGGDEDVVLDADATKVLVSLQLVEVQEFGTMA